MGDKDFTSIEPAVAAAPQTSFVSTKTVKQYFILFVLFLFIVSDIFVNNLVSQFEGGVTGRSPTVYGVIIQGTCLVILYALASYFINLGVL